MNAFFTAIKSFFKILKNPELANTLCIETKKEEPVKVSSSHLKMLSMLQQSGRLIDFLKEDISCFSDEEVGACVRKIHADCAKLLEDTVTIRHVLEENEGQSIEVNAQYDPSKIKLVGNVGEPPFRGTVVHKGWKAHKISLPKAETTANEILYAAEIEVK
jgi:hypothetical protein